MTLLTRNRVSLSKSFQERVLATKWHFRLEGDRETREWKGLREREENLADHSKLNGCSFVSTVSTVSQQATRQL